MNAAVSIITPTYNRAHLLPRVWASLLKQTERQFQWIVVDDGSNDRTHEVVQGFNDPRITYVWQENQGVNGARNRGEKEVSAEYVIYLDSDDELLEQTTLQEMLMEIQSTRPEIAWVAFTVVDAEGRTTLCQLPGHRVEANYQDHICEQKIWGEFFPIYRRDAIDIAPWPPFNGMEALRHWSIVKQRPVLLVNRPARIYHRQVDDNLTGARSTLQRSAQMAEATAQLIKDHQSAWLVHCPSQLGKYRFYRAMYLAISSAGIRALPELVAAIFYGTWPTRRKAILMMPTLFLPMALRRRLFLWRAGVVG